MTQTQRDGTGDTSPDDIDLTSTDLEDVLTKVSALAKRAIPGATEVSVTLVQDGGARTAAFTGSLALELDETQYAVGHGPCVDSARAGTTVHIRDMAAETRWPAYTPVAADRGAKASVSIGLPVQRTVIAALNIYSDQVDGFTAEALEIAKTFGGYAAVAVAHASMAATATAAAKQMQQAMESRAVIEQAKGMLIAMHGCTPDEAFDRLVGASQAANRKLRDIAVSMVSGAATLHRADN
jgi:transcriptional regulator with GAF, ATPase, and Fis domain